MTEIPPVPKSLTEQILDEMFASIEARAEFDTQIIQMLKQLALTGDLKKAPQVTKVIKSTSEERS